MAGLDTGKATYEECKSMQHSSDRKGKNNHQACFSARLHLENGSDPTGWLNPAICSVVILGRQIARLARLGQPIGKHGMEMRIIIDGRREGRWEQGGACNVGRGLKDDRG